MLKCWPVRANLQADETLTSWFMRTALSLSINPHVLRSIIFGKYRNAVFDYDMACTIDEINRLSELSGFSSEILKGATFRIRRDTSDSRRKRDGLDWMTEHCEGRPKRRIATICPKCISSRNRKYLQKDWRFSFKTVCKEHNTLLIDRCPSCGKMFPTDDEGLYDHSVNSCIRCKTKYSDMVLLNNEDILIANRFFDDFYNPNLDQRRLHLVFKLLITQLFNPCRPRMLSKRIQSWRIPLSEDMYMSIVGSLPCQVSGNTVRYLRPEDRRSVLKLAFLAYDNGLHKRIVTY